MHINNKPLYILLHIHKCGGTSIQLHIASHLSPHEYVAFESNNYKAFGNRAFIKSYFSSLSQSKTNALKAVMGSFVFYGIHKYINRPCRYVVFLRDPYKRTVSHYAYAIKMLQRGYRTQLIQRGLMYKNRNTIYPFDEWIQKKTVMHNYMARFLYNNFYNAKYEDEITPEQTNNVLRILKTFYFVGIVENQLDYAFLYNKLGVPLYAKRLNKSDSRLTPKSINIPAIEKHLTQDVRLYKTFTNTRRWYFIFMKMSLLPKWLYDRIVSTNNT